MNSILVNVTSLSWWFDILVPVVLGLLLPKIARQISTRAESVSRGIRVRRLRKIKAIRHDSLLISYEMNKASAFFVVFILITLATVMGLLLIPNTPLRSLGEMLIFWIIPVPALWAEVGWIVQDKLVKQTLQYRSKLGAQVR